MRSSHHQLTLYYFVSNEAKNMQNRLNIVVPSDYDFALITAWAKATQRPTGNLACYLLERGLAEVRKEGGVPAEILSSVNGRFFSDL